MGKQPNRAAGAGRRRNVSIVVGAIVSIVLLATALLLSNAYGAERIAENARAQHWTNATAGTASLTRAANGQAVFFAVDRELGVASDAAVAKAVAEARENLNGLQQLLDEPSAVQVVDAQIAFEALESFIERSAAVHIAIEQGDAAAALALNSTDTEEAYIDLRAAFSGIQNEVSDRIDRNESVSGLIGNITRFIVSLLIPAAALVIYRTLVKRQAMARELELAARLEAERELRRSKDEFIASISHEIRTPLTSIYGFSELLVESGMVDPEATADLVGLIHSESVELSRMVEDLLTAARVDAEALDYAIEVVDLCKEIDLAASPFLLRGAKIELGVNANVEVLADKMRLRQVLRNLLSNALRHGGENIRVVASSADGMVTFAVIDDGPGVAEDVKARLFEKFVHKGTAPLLVGSVGLGLAVAHSVIAGMGGELSYERIDNETHFVSRLPSPADVPSTGWSGDPFAADAPGRLHVAASEPIGSEENDGYGLTGLHSSRDI
jgi:signal transduction histidine kinase